MLLDLARGGLSERTTQTSSAGHKLQGCAQGVGSDA